MWEGLSWAEGDELTVLSSSARRAANAFIRWSTSVARDSVSTIPSIRVGGDRTRYDQTVLSFDGQEGSSELGGWQPRVRARVSSTRELGPGSLPLSLLPTTRTTHPHKHQPTNPYDHCMRPCTRLLGLALGLVRASRPVVAVSRAPLPPVTPSMLELTHPLCFVVLP